MRSKNDRTQIGQPWPAGSPAQPQRFRIRKLEERIAPRVSYSGGRYNPKTKWVTGVAPTMCL